MEKFEIVMIGNTAVGKTSMLSALSSELKKYNKAGALQLRPTTSEFAVLQDKWNELLRVIANNEEFKPVQEKLGSTDDFTEHPFKFQVEGKDQCHVVFVDTNGAFTRKLDDELVGRVNTSFGVFCVVDAAVMMECPEHRHNTLNRPNEVGEILNQVYTDGDGYQPRFIAFILTKCEKYMATQRGREKLAARFHSYYDNLVDMLKDVKTKPHVYMLAIQTMGCVQFSEVDENGELVFVVMDNRLKPKDCAYPLILLLRNTIEELEEKKGFFTRIKEFLGLQKPLTAYLEGLEKSAKKPSVYEEL